MDNQQDKDREAEHGDELPPFTVPPQYSNMFSENSGNMGDAPLGGFLDMNTLMQMMGMMGAAPIDPNMFGASGHFSEQGNEVEKCLQEGMMLVEMGQVEEGLEKMLEAEQMAKNGEDLERQAIVLNNIAHAYSLKGDTTKAKESLYKSIELCKGNKDEEGEAVGLRGVASILIEENTTESCVAALDHLENAIAISERLGDKLATRRTKALMHKAKMVAFPNDPSLKLEEEEQEEEYELGQGDLDAFLGQMMMNGGMMGGMQFGGADADDDEDDEDGSNAPDGVRFEEVPEDQQ